MTVDPSGPGAAGGGPLLVLVGPPGSPVPAVGPLVAERLGVGFRDTDDDVARVAGQPVAEIFLEHGEAHFRSLERAAVQRALAGHPGVLALGGGAVLDEDTRRRLAGRHVVFLDVGVPDAARRIGFNRDRPALLGNPRAQWLRLMEARRPLYEQVSTLRVPTDGRTPDEMAQEIAETLAARLPVAAPEGRQP